MHIPAAYAKLNGLNFIQAQRTEKQDMGTKDSKLTPGATDSAEDFVDRLRPLGDVTGKKMFGGYGIFESGKMFALVNSQGVIFLKAVDANRPRFEQAGSPQHGKMPYFQIPEEVLADDDQLFEWSAEAIQLSKA